MMQANPNPQIHALIASGGTGTRAGGDIPKQYQLLAGKPAIAHTLEAFAAVPNLTSITVVVAANDEIYEDIAKNNTKHNTDTRIKTAPVAGATRADTVRNGLQHLLANGAAPNDWVLVHDAARCLIEPAQIMALIAACENDAVGGLLAIPLTDTLKSADAGRSTATLDRSNKWLAQTPQMFRLQMLLDALKIAQNSAGDTVTDEASAIEQAGHAPLLVRGSSSNFKITYPDDFVLAELILQHRQVKK